MCFKTSGPGPHPMSCLIAWWLDAGCTLNGDYSSAVHAAFRVYLNGIDVDSVKHHMALYFQYAAVDVRYRNRCFGN